MCSNHDAEYLSTSIDEEGRVVHHAVDVSVEKRCRLTLALIEAGFCEHQAEQRAMVLATRQGSGGMFEVFNEQVRGLEEELAAYRYARHEAAAAEGWTLKRFPDGRELYHRYDPENGCGD
jgi:hypothetical protein